jgi:DNA-binding MurR/RpiR family transcriptional regulator
MRSEQRTRLATDVIAPPETFAELAHRLQTIKTERRGGLSTVASFALEQPLEVALGTVRSIAERCGTHPPTVVYLAHALGFGGFPEMRKFIQRLFRPWMIGDASGS